MFTDSCPGTGQASAGTIQARQRRQSLYIETCGCGPWISNSLSALDFLLSYPLISLPSGPPSVSMPVPHSPLSFRGHLLLPQEPVFPAPSLCPPAYFQSPSFAPVLKLFSLFLDSLSIFSLLQSLSFLSLSLSVLVCLFSSLPFFFLLPISLTPTL